MRGISLAGRASARYPTSNPAFSMSAQSLPLVLTAVVVAVVVAVLIPNFVEMQLRARRAELPSNVDGLKTALLSYRVTSGHYLPCGDRETASRKARGDGREAGRADGDDCWEQLGFRPAVRGGYWIEVGADEDGTPGFVVHGLSDVDGDGVYAEYTATVLENATRVTPEGQD